MPVLISRGADTCYRNNQLRGRFCRGTFVTPPCTVRCARGDSLKFTSARWDGVRGRARVRHKGRQREGQKTKHETHSRESLLATCRSLRKEHLIPYALALCAGGNRQAEATKGDRRGSEEGTARTGEREREHLSPRALVYRR